jgi:hydrogenase expression/formation protein HypC
MPARHIARAPAATCSTTDGRTRPALVAEVANPGVESLGSAGQSGAPSPPEGTDKQEADPKVCLAIPGRVLEVVDESNRLAKVDVAGVRRNVNIGLFDGDDAIVSGDWVLIHVGFAISKIDEEEARATRALLEGMGAEYEQELAELRESVIE